MLIVETIGRIRREHFVKGKSIKEIVRALKVSRNTVRKVLRSGSTLGERTGREPGQSGARALLYPAAAVPQL
jgi:transposase